MRHLVRGSILQTLELDVSGNDVSAAADLVADWLEETGGLYASGEMNSREV